MPAMVTIYDDDESIQTLLRDLFDGEGLTVNLCRSVMELHQTALAGARLAITDSWGTCHQCLESSEREQIRGLARLIPTILISGRAWATRAEASELGLVALVRKPFDVDELLQHVWSVLDRPGDEPIQERLPGVVPDLASPVLPRRAG
jgi:DNA-binding NtrC family response regulator